MDQLIALALHTQKWFLWQKLISFPKNFLKSAFLRINLFEAWRIFLVGCFERKYIYLIKISNCQVWFLLILYLDVLICFSGSHFKLGLLKRNVINIDLWFPCFSWIHIFWFSDNNSSPVKYKNSQNKQGSMHFFTKYIFEKELDIRKCFTQKWKMRKE